MKVLFTFAFAIVCLSCHAQKATGSIASSRGTQTVQIFAGDPLHLHVQIWSKWTAQGRAGTAQFRIEAEPQMNGTTIGELTPAKLKDSYVRRMAGCRMWLALVGSDQFPLGTAPLNMINGVDNEGYQTTLSGSGSTTMNAAQYRDLVQRGDLTISWNCPQ